MTRDPNAIWQPSPNFGFPATGSHGRMGYTPRWIILHSTAGGGAVEWLTNPASGVSATYVIRQNGDIYQLVDEDDAAYANGVRDPGCDPWWNAANPNLTTISIEHEKPDKTNMIPLTAAQQEASFGLVKRICERWNIPMRLADASGGITGHFSIAPANRENCPGTYPWNELWKYLQGGTMQGATYGPDSKDFNDYFALVDPYHWTCKQTGAVVQYGNLALYSTMSISGYLPVIGLPLESEQYHTEQDGYSWSSQQFERATIYYDPEHRRDNQPGMGACYLAHVNPPQTVEKIPATVTNDLQQIAAIADKYK